MKPMALKNSWWGDEFAGLNGEDFIYKKDQYINLLTDAIQNSSETDSFAKQIESIDGLFIEYDQFNDSVTDNLTNSERPAANNLSELMSLNATKRDLNQRISAIKSNQDELDDSINRKGKYIEKLKVRYADTNTRPEKLNLEIEWVTNKLQLELEKKALIADERRLDFINDEIKSISKLISDSIPGIAVNELPIDTLSLEAEISKLKAEVDVLNEQINQNLSSETDAHQKSLNYFSWLKKATDYSQKEIRYLLQSSMNQLSDETIDESGLSALSKFITESMQSFEDEHELWLERIDRFLIQPSTLSIDEVNYEVKRSIDSKAQQLAHDAKLTIGSAQSLLSDLELLNSVIEDKLATKQGFFSSTIGGLSSALSSSWSWFTESINRPLFSIGEQPITIYPLIKLMLIILAGFLVSKIVGVLIRRYERKKGIQNNSSVYLFNRVIHYLIIFIATMAGFKALGLNLGNFALIAGALSVGIGFGLQNLVSNFVSGLTIMLEKTLKVGDFIEMDTGITGTVKAINARSTQINTNDNIDVIIPNADLVTNTVTNWTLRESIRRIKIPFGVAYGSDKELVKKAALEAAHQVQYTITQVPGKEPEVWMTGFGDSSVDYWLLVWVSEYGATRPNRMRAYYLWELETQLAKYKIEIPFPQRDIHIKGDHSLSRDTNVSMLKPKE